MIGKRPPFIVCDDIEDSHKYNHKVFRSKEFSAIIDKMLKVEAIKIETPRMIGHYFGHVHEIKANA